MIIAKPASYMTTQALRAMALDYDLTTYNDVQLAEMLARASSVADSLMKKSYIAREVTLQYEGNGSNQMDLRHRPIIYIKKVEITVPGVRGWLIPLDQLLVDYEKGSLKIYQPILWWGSYFALFPRGATIEVTFGYGYGYPVSQPTYTLADERGGTLDPGPYDVAITAQTPAGETTGTVQTVMSVSGAIIVTVAPSLGAALYRAYAAPSGATPLMLVGESAHTNYGVTKMQIVISNLSVPIGMWQDTLPTADTSAHVVPNAIAEATSLLLLARIFEQNNLANRGIYMTRSGGKSVSWKSTEGNSGRGVPTLWQQATEILKPYSTMTVL